MRREDRDLHSSAVAPPPGALIAALLSAHRHQDGTCLHSLVVSRSARDGRYMITMSDQLK